MTTYNRVAGNPRGSPSLLTDSVVPFERDVVDGVVISDSLLGSIQVTEDYPANPDVVLTTAENDVNSHLQTSGAIVELEPGNYGDQRISPAQGVYLFCRAGSLATQLGETDSFNPAVFETPILNTKNFLDAGGNNVTLRGLKIDRYGLGENVTEPWNAGIRFPSGSSGWHLWECILTRSIATALQPRGSDHTIERVRFHDCGRYGWSDGSNSSWLQCEVFRIAVDDGSELVPTYGYNGDKGAMKLAGGSTGCTFTDTYLHDADVDGLWWDGARDGIATGVVARNWRKNPVKVEVCWGGADTAPPGKSVTWPDPAFVISDLDIIGNTDLDPNNPTFWPGPAGLLCSMTPGVHLLGTNRIENAGNGTGSIYSALHNIFDQGYPAQGISAEWCQDNLHSRNVRFENTEYVGPMANWTAGHVTDPVDEALWVNNDYSGVTNPEFRFGDGNNRLDLSEWLALGHS